jgi:hypothetical protein
MLPLFFVVGVHPFGHTKRVYHPGSCLLTPLAGGQKLSLTGEFE